MKLIVSTSSVMMMLVLGHVYFGAGFLVGGPQYMSSPSYDVARIWAPENAWGWWLVLGAVLSLAAPFVPVWWGSGILHTLASIPLTALALALAIGTPHAAGWGGPVLYLTPVLLHFWVVRSRYQHAQLIAAQGAAP